MGLQKEAIPHRDAYVATLEGTLCVANGVGEPPGIAGIDKEAGIKFVSQPGDHAQFDSRRLLKCLHPFPRIGSGTPDTQLRTGLNVETGYGEKLDQQRNIDVVDAVRIPLVHRVASLVVEDKSLVFVAVCGVEQLELQVETGVACVGYYGSRLTAHDIAGLVVEYVFGVSHRRPVDTRFTAHAPLGPRRAGYGRQAEKQQHYHVFAAKTIEWGEGEESGVHGCCF